VVDPILDNILLELNLVDSLFVKTFLRINVCLIFDHMRNVFRVLVWGGFDWESFGLGEIWFRTGCNWERLKSSVMKFGRGFGTKRDMNREEYCVKRKLFGKIFRIRRTGWVR